ncbi:glycoside hydrolase family 3 protein [Didymella exigua CBS 183.55]|uniref:Probable beta-glucosidase E n=1 Tax=Didymella exigua CBS 183.55 TaxID=1150837 RepID=A0A6A5RQE8_9PLEO|nr:glycoside hydrolase family 3 protein [Didymella exigua CBS 183.55]KAF1929388.1 glycoside hydrolase family 3 protein [Didymella exigua CBS 183.55]
MPPYESHQPRRGKYARLDAPTDDDAEPTPTRFSSESNATLEDLEEHDPLAFDRKLKRKKSAGDLKVRKASGKDSFARRKGLSAGRCCCWLLTFVAATVLLLAAGGIWAYKASVPLDGLSPAWYPSPKGGADPLWEQSYKKAAELVKQMTLVEKVNITTGTGWSMDMCVGNNGAVPRLKFPQLCLQDGPLGIRFADNISAFPAGVTVGATWNKELMYQRGKAHGKEARLKGINVLLGPAMGPLGRMPAGGRNWEGFGSDPVLQGIAAAQTIKGIQEEGVMATAKHYIGNEQEHFRQAWEWGIPNAISSNIDDRTLHEMYAWPFADSVKAGVTSVMCSYNQVNSSYACANSKLLNGVLKDELGFQGFVQSDWLAQRSGVASALAGLDMTMPGDGLRWAKGDSLWGAKLTQAVLNGSVPIDRVNDMVTRIVASWYQVGQDKWSSEGPNFSSWTNDEVGKLHEGSPSDKTTGVVNKFVNAQGDHKDIVRKVAAEGTVLVKNEGSVLPLSRKGHKDGKSKRQTKFRVAVFGEDARLPHDGINKCPDQSCNDGTLASGWGSGAVDFPYLVEPMSAIREAFDKDSVYVTDWLENKLPKQKEIVEDQDLCIVFVNSDAGEGYLKWSDVRGDRNDLSIQKGGNELVKDVAKDCGKGSGDVVVVVHTVGPVILEEFIDIPNVKAVLIAHLPGQESGNAIVDVLFGDVNPSGHLPYTIAKKEEDFGPGSKVKYLPSPSDGLAPQQNFSEGLYIDYRHFDKQSIAPRYEFGYGLSYTIFNLSNLVMHSTHAKSPLASPRPAGIAPPSYPTDLPSPESALFPKNFVKIEKYIYPYLSSTAGTSYHASVPVPQSPLSDAGGGPGGNPDLYTTLLTVSCSVANTGPRDGAVVVQLYLSFPQGYTDPDTGEAVDFPVRVLRGFEKLHLQAGARERGLGGTRQEVQFNLTRRDLSYWHVGRGNWVLPSEGKFGVAVGFSSRDLPLQGSW